MRIAVCHPSLNRGGGAERVCLATIKALMGGGHNVTLLTVDKTDWILLRKRFGEVLRPNEEFYIFERLPGKGWFSQAAFLAPLFVRNLFASNLGDFDLIFNSCGELFDLLADVAYVNALPFRIMHFYKDSGYPNLWRVKFSSQACNFFVKNFSHSVNSRLLLANSKFLRHIIEKHFHRGALVVYPPVEVGKFINFGKELENRDNVVVSVSRLRSGKNLGIIPKVAQIVGKGEFLIFCNVDQASLEVAERLIQEIDALGVGERVKLFVNEPFEKVREALSSAKIFLHTQFLEAFGISVVEGMAAGCVPVVPRCGGPWFDILDCKQGVYGFSYASVEEAAGLVGLLLSNEGLRVDVAARACERARIFDGSVFEGRLLRFVEAVFRRKFG